MDKAYSKTVSERLYMESDRHWNRKGSSLALRRSKRAERRSARRYGKALLSEE